MKISANPQLRTDLPNTKSRGEAIVPDTDFQTVLKQTVGRTTGALQVAPAAHSCGPQSVQTIRMPEAESVLPLVDRVDRLVDRLENYRHRLADPQTSLKSIQPLLNDITAATEKLAPELERLDEGDPLKDILNRSLVTASVATTRFNRGDYL